MVEWRLTPEYINRFWTEELLALMFQKRSVRYERMQPHAVQRPKSYVSNDEFFRKHNIPVKIKRRRQ